VAGPGDEMPGGGHFATASNIAGWQLHMNNAGEIVFNATLDTATLRNDTVTPSRTPGCTCGRTARCAWWLGLVP